MASTILNVIVFRRYIGFCFRSFEVILIATDVGRFSGLRVDDGQVGSDVNGGRGGIRKDAFGTRLA